MRSEYPYPGFTWQVSQHIAVVRETYFLGLLKACAHLDGCELDIQDIDSRIAEQGIITSDTDRSIWRDYQQVLCEFGFMYSTASVGNRIRLTPIAREFLASHFTFSEALTNQLLKYQYPNGKSTISKGIKEVFPQAVEQFATLTDLQEHFDVKIRPLPFVWLMLDKLCEKLGHEDSISAKEMAIYVFRCRDYGDLDECVEAIIKYRAGLESLELPSWKVERNALDWITLMGMTRFFVKTPTGIKRSLKSIKKTVIIRSLFESLCDVSSFWTSDDDGAVSWYEYFGAVDDPLRSLIVRNGKLFWDFFPSIITRNILENHTTLLED